MNYDLQRFGPLGFQDVAAALTIAQFGPVVRRLGRGRDGGRDMEANGSLVWSSTAEARGEVWDGHTVFQVKHHERLGGTKDDARWLWGEIRKELAAWAEPDSNRQKVPNHLVFVTNVRLSPDPVHGGLAYVENKVQAFIKDLRDTSQDIGPTRRSRQERRGRMQPLRKWRIIDGNDVEALLDIHEGVRRAYGGFLTAGDVLANLSVIGPDLPAAELELALQVHARSAAVRERNIYFDEAGGDGPGVALDRIAVDLPCRIHESGESARVLQFVLDRGEHVLRPSVTSIGKPRHIVITGPPGNGKTTVSRFLVQVYRAAMLNDAANLADDHRSVIKGTEAKLGLMQRVLPHHRRWAMRVDLAEFAKQYVSAERKSLIAWIARQVTAQGYSRKLEPWVLKKWMTAWPWFIALDGLDEVAEPTVRKWVISAIQEFAADAEADDCDVHLLVTTRPTGYVNEMPTEQFERLDLDDLDPGEALAYGHLVTQIRLGNDVGRIARVDSQLTEAAGKEALRHLLRTPLQVQIMSIIAEGAGTFDPDRFSLFWRYYDVVARREQNKEHTRFAELLREHAAQILDLHERVGLELQARSEIASGGTAWLSESELSETAWAVLADEGYDPSGKHADLLERIVLAATQRLVLLAPRGEGFGFDVRSLQELMAARRLTTGTLDAVTKRLERLAASPHWRNTWLFAAGRIFAEPQAHQHDALINLVLTLDENASDRLASVYPIGPYLAWDMLDDGMAASRPRRLQQLITHGMEALTYPAPQPMGEIAFLVVRLARTSDTLRIQLLDLMREALGRDESTRTNASALQNAIEGILGTVDPQPDIRALARVKREPGRSLPAEPPDGWSVFEEAITAFAVPPNEELIKRAASAIRTARSQVINDRQRADLEDAALQPEVAQVLELALERIVRAEPGVAAVCVEVARSTASRRQTADEISDISD